VGLFGGSKKTTTTNLTENIEETTIQKADYSTAEDSIVGGKVDTMVEGESNVTTINQLDAGAVQGGVGVAGQAVNDIAVLAATINQASLDYGGDIAESAFEANQAALEEAAAANKRATEEIAKANREALGAVSSISETAFSSLDDARDDVRDFGESALDFSGESQKLALTTIKEAQSSALGAINEAQAQAYKSTKSEASQALSDIGENFTKIVYAALGFGALYLIVKGARNG
jgi:ankyrin repeat protein